MGESGPGGGCRPVILDPWETGVGGSKACLGNLRDPHLQNKRAGDRVW